MKPERWKQVDELFEAALDCPTTERAAFLDRTLSREAESVCQDGLARL